MTMKQLQHTSYLFSNNAPFVEELYASYLKKPTSVSLEWQEFFQNLQSQDPNSAPDLDHAVIREEFVRRSRESRTVSTPNDGGVSHSLEAKQVHVLQLINAYRFRGHQQANFDPLMLRPQDHVPELDMAYHHLSESDLDTDFNTGSLIGPRQSTLREIFNTLRLTYCGHIGCEYMHITDTDEKRWLQKILEGNRGESTFSDQHKVKILERVVAASEFEKYLHTRYVGQKRFSLEGAESLIPALDELIALSGMNNVSEIVVGMAHRGRLNVLTNILGKSPDTLFKEFEGRTDEDFNGSGDVKYHMGFSSDIQTKGGVVHLALSFNPSHLEIVSPVVEGSVRARQDKRLDERGSTVLPVLIHGDAAFAGQGVVMETFQMSQARGYTTGGTIHFIINNQIGFTTSNPLDSRSSVYCTEVARMVQAPIFHVNGDDPEAVVYAMQLAFEYRQKYQKDVVVDMVCYRRHGHSEADEPSATQPMMYSKIKSHSKVSQLYADRLNEQGIMTGQHMEEMQVDYRSTLDKGQCVAHNIMTEPFDMPYWVDWRPYATAELDEEIKTTLSKTAISDLVRHFTFIPDYFTPHKQVTRIIEGRKAMARGEQPMDWGFAETLAYASILQSGIPVRVSGQDCSRGTFFHRHAILHDQKNGSSYTPLNNISVDQANLTVIDSILSEEAVLGFEYGYSTAAPYTLVIWEAQFGDFANGAQVVIDQFISSGESKWDRLSGLVMFLPHGFDGQGPEHSSARLERYLQLCGEDNIQVCMPTLPGQMFHLLRRQILRNIRKPLIVMTPKSLLRHKLSTSGLSDICDHSFQSVIGETENIKANHVERIIICSGKVYFDLLDARSERGLENIAIIRLEQLYPFPEKQLAIELKRYRAAKQVMWCQEEPLNQGAWNYMLPILTPMMKKSQELVVTARPASASPAVGYYQKHIEQLQTLMDDALS
jgi:2-oxoglutarate dehydrogenase E1 component